MATIFTALTRIRRATISLVGVGDATVAGVERRLCPVVLAVCFACGSMPLTSTV